MKTKNYIQEIEKGNYALALTMLDKELTTDPENPELLYNFAICCSRTENHNKCIETLNFLLKRSGKFIERDNVFRLIIFSYIQLESYPEALELIRERLKVNTDDTTLLSFRAHIQEKRNQVEEAIKTHKKILTIHGDYKNSLNSLGYLLINQREATQEEINLAIDCLKKALALEPKNAAYLDSFGVLLGALGNNKQAEKAFRKALEQWPDNQEILANLDKVLQAGEKTNTPPPISPEPNIQPLQPEKMEKKESPPVATSPTKKANKPPEKNEASALMQEAKTLMDEIMQHTKDFDELEK